MLQELMAQLMQADPESQQRVIEQAKEIQKNLKFIPNDGPQTDAYNSKADLLLYGGSGGAGKSSLLIGLALSAHRRSLIMRRRYTDLGALTEEAIRMNGTREGFNGSSPPKLRAIDGRLLDFGACANLGDEAQWQGNPHDFIGFDEAAQFLKMQVQFIMGWLRTVDQGQRTRVVLATNPPLTAEGEWLIEMFAPWLDLTHPNPARAGELRWFITAPDGRDMEVSGPEPVEIDGQSYRPLSRSFIPAKVEDNPFLAQTDYKAKLDALPEPMRSAVRDGNFMAARRDDELQVIPTEWIRDAQRRWTKRPPAGVPMCAIGVDVAQGGSDSTVLAPRYDGWYSPLIVTPGEKTPTGAEVAGLIISHRRDAAVVVVDVGGGYGGATIEHLKANFDNLEQNIFTDLVKTYRGSDASTQRTRDRTLRFRNKRAETWWRFREALDPGQEMGSIIALPDDPMLLSELTSVRLKTMEIGSKGIQIESKEDIIGRLGRSPDRADAVVMAWSAGNTIANQPGGWKSKGNPQRYKIVMGHQEKRRIP